MDKIDSVEDASALRLAERWEEGSLPVVSCTEVYADGALLRSRQYLEILEEKQCLEKVVLPVLLSEKSSTAVIMTAAALLSLKAERGQLAAAVNVMNFADFFDLAATWALDQDTDHLALSTYLRFLIACFSSLEIGAVRKACLRYTSLPVWLALSPKNRSRLLKEARLDAHWHQIEKSRATTAKYRREALLIPTLAGHVAELSASSSAESSPDLSLYVANVLDLLRDLMSQVSTRRFLHSVLQETRLYERLTVSSEYFLSQANDVHSLHSLPRVLAAFGQAMEEGKNFCHDQDSYAKRREAYYTLQCACFEHFATTDFGREIAFGSFREAPDLTQVLQKAPKGAASKLAHQVLDLYPDFETSDDLAIRAIVHDLAKRRSSHHLIEYKSDSLFPDETIFDTKDAHLDEDRPLALPKLNLQFLSLHDYLQRNLELYRLEAFSEIRDEVNDVANRLKVSTDAWARMACRIVNPVSITAIEKPKLGHTQASRVECELTIELPHQTAEEWDTEVRESEVLLLAQISSDGVKKLRGAHLVSMTDEAGEAVGAYRTQNESPVGSRRTLRLALCPAQHMMNTEAYASLNVVIRRPAKQNNFAAVLETIRNLMSAGDDQKRSVPSWLLDLLLGYGDPGSAHFRALTPLDAIDFGDTFLDAAHLEETFDTIAATNAPSPGAYARVVKGLAGTSSMHIEWYAEERARNTARFSESPILELESVRLFGAPRRNEVRFTKTQMRAVIDCVNDGLSLILGPPGTGKTDVAVQAIATILRNNPESKVVVVAHSNAALNDLFQKLERRGGIEPRELVRLGSGARDLDLDESYSALGRLEAAQERRKQLLNEVQRIAHVLGAEDAAAGYSCESAQYFDLALLRPRLEAYFRNEVCTPDDFPLRTYFSDDLFTQGGSTVRSIALAAYEHVQKILQEVESYRPLELLRSRKQQIDFLIANRARLIAMTCTHAAIARRELVELGFNYDTLVVEEAGQMLEIETFIPMLLQPTIVTPLVLREDPLSSSSDSSDDEDEEVIVKRTKAHGKSSLRRMILLGDDKQLPPVVKNSAIAKRCNLVQSLFARLLRLGAPCVQLDAQARSRPSLADLWRWNYSHPIRDLPQTVTTLANRGFVFEYQFIHVSDGNESCPVQHLFQNLEEAEYIVATYQYMRLLGYPASSIAILATYRGQSELIRDILDAKCRHEVRFGMPKAVATVDKFQGQQADFVLLSLVRTRRLGHLRDPRRLVVAFSRARFGLYVFGWQPLFVGSVELQAAFSHFFTADRPTKLNLAFDDLNASVFSRSLEERPNNSQFVLDGNEMYTLCRSIESMQANGDIPIPQPFLLHTLLSSSSSSLPADALEEQHAAEMIGPMMINSTAASL